MFYAKADAPAKPKLTLECEGGTLSTNFTRTSLGGSFQKFETSRGAFTARGDPDLSRVTGISFGFGLWQFDTRKRGFTITMAKLAYVGTETLYVVPKPTRGVAVDGEFKDWGIEDNLYNWTPPDYVYLNERAQVVPLDADWGGPAHLSGRFAFMMDERNLYFLALVSDATPFQGVNPENIWNNDSIELFLSFRPTSQDARFGKRRPDAQVAFHCGKDPGRIRCFVQGKPANVAVTCKIVPHTWLTRGQQSKGFVLEATIPLAAVGLPEHERGTRVGYSIKLNDSEGTSLLATPENPKPHATIKDFRTAFVEIPLQQEKRIVFGEPARDVFWPEQYTPERAPLRIWDMGEAHRKRVSQTIDRLYLNTFWAVQASESGDTAPKSDAWVYMPLPMGIGWYTPVFEPVDSRADKLGPEQNYALLGGRQNSFFWYERLFTPPAEFREGRVLLTFKYVNEEATVYLNKRLLGKVDSAHRTLDVTRHLRYGKENRIDVLLYCPVKPGYSVRNGWGMSGDIHLEHHSHAPEIRDVWVKTASGFDGSFEMVVETLRAEPGTTLVIDILDKGDKVLAHAEQSASKSPIHLTGQCREFRSWSPEQPNLSRLRVRYKRAGEVLDERFMRFGFRSFEIRKARFLLNGKVLRLRAAHASTPSHVMEPGRLGMLKHYGHNSVFLHAATLATTPRCSTEWTNWA
ncbi:MAG: hypothetical protein KAI66_23325 [Lentisphaeria bacterium]|nr:hypothetical protein [Lentisphaeria bacterium]